MRPCQCQEPHERLRIVLTGGPGAGKTAVLELVRQHFCRHVHVLPEAASMLFGGGFPRGRTPGARQAAQEAIFHVQRGLEVGADADNGNHAVVLCDRGTVDGAAYWPGPEDFWQTLRTSRLDELARYDGVIHLRTPPAGHYNHVNPVRVEDAAEAAAIDARIAQVWDGHPRRFFVESAVDFISKAQAALAVLRQMLPPCCRHTVGP